MPAVFTVRDPIGLDTSAKPVFTDAARHSKLSWGTKQLPPRDQPESACPCTAPSRTAAEGMGGLPVSHVNMAPSTHTERSYQGSSSLPRRSPVASFVADPELDPPEGPSIPPGLARAAGPALHAQLTALRQHVPGVLGCVLATMDGLLVDADMTRDGEPHDLAVLAASAFGVGRQCGLGLRQGAFREATFRSETGHFIVYAVTNNALLAVLTDDRLDIGWLHREAWPLAGRIAALLSR